MKKINITTIILLVYVIALAVYNWVTTQPDVDYVQFFSVFGLSLVVVGLLRYVQIRRFKFRNKVREEREKESK